MADSKTFNPTEMQKNLTGITYPATKQQIVNYLKINNSPKEMIDAVNKLSNRQYIDSNDFEREMGIDGMEETENADGGDNADDEMKDSESE